MCHRRPVNNSRRCYCGGVGRRGIKNESGSREGAEFAMREGVAPRRQDAGILRWWGGQRGVCSPGRAGVTGKVFETRIKPGFHGDKWELIEGAREKKKKEGGATHRRRMEGISMWV